MPPPFDPRLLDALEANEIGVVGGTVWRQILDPTSALRPNQRGARWNPPGVETLYCSLDPQTAAAEIDNLINSQPVPITRQRRTFAITIKLSRAVDLRQHGCSANFGYDYDLNDPAACQSIGAAASWLGFSGLIVPSLRGHADNLVVFVANLEPDDDLHTVDPSYPYPPGPPSSATWASLHPLTS